MFREQLLQTPDSLRGRLIEALHGALRVHRGAKRSENGVGPVRDTEMFDHAVSLLDEAIPLQGASHAEVIEYSVEIPMRYAECIALLSDGRKVGLEDPRKFLGWSSHDPTRSLMFRHDGGHLEVEVEAHCSRQSPGNIRNIILKPHAPRRVTRERKFIAIDGSLIMLAGA